MKRQYLRAACLILLACAPALLQAQTDKRKVSVLPFSYAEGVSKADAKTLGSLFEAALIKTQVFDVIEQTEAATVLKSQEYAVSDCTDESCAVQVGKLLAADHILLGTVSVLGSKTIVTVKLIDIEKGRSLKAESASAANLEKLSEEMATLANLLTSGEATGGRGRVEMVGEESKTATPTGTAAADVLATVTFQSDPADLPFRVLDAGGKALFEGITPQALRLGQAVYNIEASDKEGLYRSFKEKLTVSGEGKMRYTITLVPDFGAVSITSDPPGADVVLGGMKVGSTPFRQERLKTGKYDFLLQLNLYDSRIASVKVDAGQTATVSEKLTAAFIQLSVRETAGLVADLSIDGKSTGRLPYLGKLPFRNFTVLVTPTDSRYKPYEELVGVRTRGETIERAVKLEGRFGSVWVNADPLIEAPILVDGKEMGTVPEDLSLLIGTHEITVRGMSKGQLVSATQTVTVQEKASLTLTLKLTPDRYQKTAEGWATALDGVAALMTRKTRVGQVETLKVRAVLDEIARADFSFPEMKVRAEALLKSVSAEAAKWDRGDRVRDAESAVTKARTELEAGRGARGSLDTAGWISLGLGALFGGLSGMGFWQSEDAYGKYNAAQYSKDITTYRSQAELWDGLKIGSLIAGGVGLILSPILLNVGPRTAEKEREVKDLEGRLAALKAEGEWY